MTPSWLTIAQSSRGLQETTGEPVILGWASQVGGWVASYFTSSTKMSWCALFMEHCITSAGCKGLGQMCLTALNWVHWGVPAPNAAPGVILVLDLGKGDHHVTLYESETTMSYNCIGGNQSNQVKTSSFPKSAVIAMRWPGEVPFSGEPMMGGQAGGATTR